MLPPPYSDEAAKPLGPTKGQQAMPLESPGPQKMDQNQFPTNQWPAMCQPSQMGYSGSGPIFFAPSPSKVLYDNYKAGQSKFLGISQIIIGVLCIVIGAAVLIVKEYKRYLGNFEYAIPGIWGGIFLIITGSFGTAAGVHKTRGVESLFESLILPVAPILCSVQLLVLSAVITFMVLGIISTIDGASLMLFNAGDIYKFSLNNNNPYQILYDSKGRGYTDANFEQVKNNMILSSHILLLILSLFQGIFSLWGSIICCRVACCCANSHVQYTMLPQPTMMMMNPMNDNPQALGYSNFGYSNASSNSMNSNNLAEAPMNQSMDKKQEDDDEEF